MKRSPDAERGGFSKVKPAALLALTALAAAASASVSVSALRAAPADPSLVAHWSFDPSSGTTLPDDSGNGHTGTLVGSPAWTPGRLGNALSFSGGDVVTVGDIPQIRGVGQLTFAVWMRRSAPYAKVLVGKQATAQDVALEAWDDGNLYFQLSSGADTYGYLPLNDAAWHHVALVFDGSATGNANRLRAYVDGQQRALAFNGSVGTATTTDTTPFRIGEISGETSSGQVDDAWLFARTLSEAEIQDLARATPDAAPDAIAPTAPTGLLASATSATEVSLSWTAATDDVGVAGYRVYRDGAQVGTTSATAFQDAGVSGDRSYTYTVRAYDAAGNQSADSDAATVTTPAPAATLGARFVTGISSNGRYFVDQAGAPILIRGDSPWAMFADLSPDEVERWAANRERYGMNAAIVSLVGSPGNGGRSYDGATFDGVLPFVGGDVTAWNEAYWSRMDAYLAILARHGITAFLYPVDGWTTLPGATFYEAPAASSYRFGQMVATRFAGHPNIVWMVGGDYDGWVEAVNTTFENVLAGIRSVGDRRLVSLQLNPESVSTDVARYEPLVDWNFAYSYSTVYSAVLSGYQRAPGSRDPRPVVLGESRYQGEASGSYDETLRREQLWALTSGSAGDFTGSADWLFYSGWESRLDTTWVAESQRIRDFFSALSWWALVPDDAAPFVTAGRGEKVSNHTGIDVVMNDYVTAAQTPDRSVSLVYVPTSLQGAVARTITLDLGRLPVRPTAVWVDPTDATSSLPATISSDGRVTTPGLHADGSRDWLLYVRP